MSEVDSKQPQQDPRKCPYCHEAVQREAKKCPHCGALIDPRFPNTLLDEATYKHVRMIVVQDIKDEILTWANSYSKRLAAFLAIVVPLGVWGFVKLTATQFIERQTESKLSELIAKETESETAAQLHPIKMEQDARLSLIDLSLSNLAWYADSLSSQLRDSTNEIHKTQEMAQGLHFRTKQEVKGLIDRVSARMEPGSPHVLLKEPSSILGEYAAVLYVSGDMGIRFRWEWAADQRESAATNSVIYSVRVGRWPYSAATQAFETNTVFNSLKIRGDSLSVRPESDSMANQGKFWWQVSVMEHAGSKPSISSPVGVFEIYSNVTERVKATGELRVGISAEESPPFVMRTAENPPRLDGLDIRITEHLAAQLRKKLGTDDPIDPVYRQFDWIPLLNAPRNNEADLIISSITIKPERTNLYGILFSKPYYETHQSLLFLTDAEFGQTAAKLEEGSTLPVENKLVAVDGTTGQQAANALAVTADQVLIEKDVNAIVSAVLNGRAKAAVVDLPIAEAERDKHDPGVLQIHELKQTAFADRYGIAVSTGESQLLEDVNECLDELQRGRLDDLCSAYGLR